MMIERKNESETLRHLFRRYPVVGIIGARQVGKTTLARYFAAQARGRVSYFDLRGKGTYFSI